MLAALLFFPMVVRAQLPSGACYIEDATCEMEGDNLVGIISGVLSLDECRQACQDDATTSCNIFTFYGSLAFPFVDSCILFSTCMNLNPCVDCFTEELVCDQIFCNAPVEGMLGDNIVRVIDDMNAEGACSNNCNEDELCQFYTYHYPNSSLYPSTCYLLSDLLEPIKACGDGVNCVSGTKNCERSMCGFVDKGYLTSGVLVEETKPIELLRLGTCGTPTAIAVGGGAGVGDPEDIWAGGGSGFIEYYEFRPHMSYLQLMAYIGTGGEASFIIDVSKNTTLVRAENGNTGDSRGNGGDGYSGGGGYFNGNGGENGGNGTDDSGHGGKGSGIDISLFSTQSFALR